MVRNILFIIFAVTIIFLPLQVQAPSHLQTTLEEELIVPPATTREIRPPMTDDRFLILITVLIVAGLIAVIAISGFPKFKL